jgi:hypothetical protein
MDSPSDGVEPLAKVPGLFATTHWSVVLTAADQERPEAAEALETLCRTYWYPLYAFVRRQRTVRSDGYLQADGSTVIYGTAYHEVGTWAGTNFTPTGGLWELSFRGVIQTNYSLQNSETGYGVGGAIDGLRREETATRRNASDPHDPTVPFLRSPADEPGHAK